MQTLPATGRLDGSRHIGFITDGNRRWVAAHGTTVGEGFRQGAVVVHQVLEHCRTIGVETSSVFLMSDRNFGRLAAEVETLVDVLVALLNTQVAASTGPIRVLTQCSGTNSVPARLLAAIERAEKATTDRHGMTVCLGIGYDGRADIRRAVAGALAAVDYDERRELPVDGFLSTCGLPDPALISRTSGERRLSGFLLHQAADATLCFEDRCWPDYTHEALGQSLVEHFQQRRTFGR
ncbi:polyprenyl diphosphate synthase [Streptomyces sp. NPDC090499]|uniref:polyprenyl diphosphate synthase n=1 Tax=Streptomyces sp. NPDC090499 TaxID=3365965 RepID=UPI0037FEFE3C